MTLSKEAKEARNAYLRKWRNENKDHLKAYQKEYRKANPDKFVEYTQRYWEKKVSSLGE